MNKESAVTILNELFNKVQEMRETGNSDLRTVLHFIGEATREVESLGNEEDV